MIRLAPCAVFLSAFAAAGTVEVPTTSGGTGTTAVTPVTGTGINANMGLPSSSLSGPTLQGGISVAPAPTLNNGGVAPAGVVPMGVVSPAGVVPVGVKPVATVSPVTGKAAPVKPVAANGQRTAGAQTGKKDFPPSASTVLDKAADGIAAGRKAEAAGVDGQSVRQALDRAYDSTAGSGDIGGGAAGGVAGKFSSAREKIASLVGVANNSAPADAPGLYGSAIKTAEQTLPAAVAAAVTKAVLGFAAQKAEISLTPLAQAAYNAAAAGQSTEARRLVKSLDKWEELLGAPGRPLITNGDRLKAGVETALSGASRISGSNPSAPRVWLVKKGGSFVAALPGSTVEKVPGLGASFALDFKSALSLSPMADAYRAFSAKPGLRSAIAARVALGESVPSATLGTGWLWLKHLVRRAWSALTAMLPGRGLPSVANAKTMPRLQEAAKSWRDAASHFDAAARIAGEPRLSELRARGAFALAKRGAVAYEKLTGESEAVARIESLEKSLDVSGDGGLRHWASLYASDARRRGAESFGKLRGETPVVVLGAGPAALAATSLVAASQGLTVTAFGDALWASGSGAYGQTKISADLRSTENGGSIVLETERGDERLASTLDALGFSVTVVGRGLSAKLDAQTMSADAAELTELAADGAALISGSSVDRTAPVAGLERLLADMKKSPKDAAKAAAGLDGASRLIRAKTVAWVGDYEAVAAEIPSRGVRVIALRDPATGLSKFARIEPLRAR